jgi:uncharacterized protein with HEPN domain
MKNEFIIEKIILYMEEIFDFSAETTTFETFQADRKTIASCTMNLLQIGELTNKLDDDYIKQHLDIPWRKIVAVRNRLAHDYEGINLEVVWEIISEGLPELLQMLKGVINE